MFSTFWLAKFGGISHRQLMYDYDKAKELGERVLREFEPDVHNPLLLNVAAGPALEAVDYKQLIWPGHGVRDDQPYQYLDREYMKADEYDEFIEDPTGFYLRKYRRGSAALSRASRNSPICPACIISAWSAAYAVSAGRNYARRSSGY